MTVQTTELGAKGLLYVQEWANELPTWLAAFKK
ncbi:hypothetical protein SAMN06265348_11331 [Pedobacter westerhofensis]|uniref:Uncharacterized protein n=1 Tax=Pedobacter westerhofensis TaxID=425512 RepID=A0A521FJH9_9SPHI|nr:hypothetical protein SAMN06265348_11331 [Pedobacter westerhofensis]